MSKGVKDKVKELLAIADIKINGKRPWDIQVKDERFYACILSKNSLGLGESYMDGWWECRAIDEMISKILTANLQKKVKFNRSLIWLWLKSQMINMQSKSRAYEVGEKHYDAGNELYRYMLDKRMMYSCGYWKAAKNLDQAQVDKLDLICKKLELKPGMTVLDLGCGWGGFAKFAAEKYKVKVLGITISKEQAKFARENCRGLNVKIKLQDYRSLNQKFDRIVSIGMFEHVGFKNYKEFMKIASNCLEDNGLFLLHTIGSNYSTRSNSEPWLNKYIFPNGQLPSVKQIAEASEKYFILEDWHNFGKDYDPTLMAWDSNFVKNWDKIKKTGNYNERFKRMWEYYLLSCAGGSRSKHIQLWQIIFSKEKKEKYLSVR
jgi:cyclopropane-fatty-acyl-phospholipid synthase